MKQIKPNFWFLVAGSHGDGGVVESSKTHFAPGRVRGNQEEALASSQRSAQSLTQPAKASIKAGVYPY